MISGGSPPPRDGESCPDLCGAVSQRHLLDICPAALRLINMAKRGLQQVWKKREGVKKKKNLLSEWSGVTRGDAGWTNEFLHVAAERLKEGGRSLVERPRHVGTSCCCCCFSRDAPVFNRKCIDCNSFISLNSQKPPSLPFIIYVYIYIEG